jgi:hypothetical protein
MAEYEWDSEATLTPEQLAELGFTEEVMEQMLADFEEQVSPVVDFPPIIHNEEYIKFSKNIGGRYNIQQGRFVEAEDGEFLVTDKLIGKGIIYLDKNRNTWSVLADNPFVGKEYILQTQNCAILTAKYLDYAKDDGVNYEKMMKSIPLKKLIYYFRNAVNPLLEELGFQSIPVSEIQVHDIIVWQFNDFATSHMGVYLGDNKLIHHIPSMISCIDTIDLNSSKVLGVYRYG